MNSSAKTGALTGLIVTVLVTGAILLIGYLLNPQANTFGWLATGAVAFVAFLVGMLVTNSFVRAGQGQGASGAVQAILWLVIAGYGLSVISTVGLYALVAQLTQENAAVLFALLLAETVAFGVAYALFFVSERAEQMEEQALKPVVADLSRGASALGDALLALASVPFAEAAHLAAADALKKRLEKAKTALAHAHGRSLKAGGPSASELLGQASAVAGVASALNGQPAPVAAGMLPNLDAQAAKLLRLLDDAGLN